ncbi:MAG: XdhC family protein [Pyrinomonadaceae bacterium]|nr:XdhC family protein [Pyrinomonadaceae bacterium]
MKEIQEILKHVDTLAPEKDAVLATVVDVRGSSYRLPGAKMLILENGDSYGTVSGGCLEADVMQHAGQVLESGEPQIFTYDTTTNDDSVFSYNMGCRGVIRILLEAIRSNPYVDFMRACFEREKGVAATSLDPGNEQAIGDRIFFVGDGIGQNEFADEEIRSKVVEILRSGRSSIERYDFGEVFFEYIAPPVSIKIFGAGADAVPLAKLANELGWHTTIIDHRTALANHERFDEPDEIIISRPEDVSVKVRFEKESFAVVMTHNYDHDRKIVGQLLKSDFPYVGLLGPKVRTENLIRELREEGLEITKDDLEKLYAPVGLDTGAHLPETIALSIIAEIQTVLAGRKGGFLKDRSGSIYDR